MSSDMIGLINLESDSPLRELNEERPLATVPIGGMFRLIDFTLSNLVNAGINNVGILLPLQARSILDHVRSGREWGLARKGDGLFYLPVDWENVNNPVEGNIRLYYKNLLFVSHSSKPYILLTGGDMVQNIDYDEVLHFHRHHNADVTMIYQKQREAFNGEAHVLQVNEQNKVVGIYAKAAVAAGDNMYQRGILIDSAVFQQCIRKAYGKGYHYFISDVLQRNIDRLRVFGYPYEGYAKRVSSIESYYQVNMDLLDHDTWWKMFQQYQRHIYTKIKDVTPAKYMEESSVCHSLVANGCIIEGRVENSIIFRKVHIGRNAVVRNSIIMQHSVIGDDAQMDYVICDKDALIQPEATLSGTQGHPMCIGKCRVI